MKLKKYEQKWLGVLDLFEPKEGQTIIEPHGKGEGYWVGAPCVIYDTDRKKFYLYYRIRKPRPVRGGECRIAESEDGINFKDIWGLKKEDLNSDSIEKSYIVKKPDGKYFLYISYVDPEDGRWRIDVMEAESPDKFSTSSMKKVLTASDIKAEGIKDPYVILLGGLYYMIVSYAPTPKKKVSYEEMHGTRDIYNTGVTKSHTGLCISSDGVNYKWLGDILSPSEDGWDSYASRISCLLYLPPVFIGFYDGSKTVKENYEEKTGLCISLDLKNYEKISTSSPVLVSPYASKSLRYMDVVQFEDSIYFYYEFAREDGSHEIRMNKVNIE